jgi:peroxiredoxin
LRAEVGGRKDVTVALVTMGSPTEAAKFCQARRLPFRCLSDPARAVYRAYGLRRGTRGEVGGLQTAPAYLRATTRGHLPGRPVGDVYQLGGVFVIDIDGTVRYAHYPRHAGDHPPSGAVSRAIEPLTAADGAG